MQQIQQMWVGSLGQEGPLEKEKTTHSSILAWRISWREEPDRLQSIVSYRVRHNWSDFAHIDILFSRWPSGKESACLYKRHKRHGFDPWVGKIPWRRKWQSAPVFLSGKSHRQRSLASYSPWGCKRVRHDLTHIHDTCIDILGLKSAILFFFCLFLFFIYYFFSLIGVIWTIF